MKEKKFHFSQLTNKNRQGLNKRLPFTLRHKAIKRPGMRDLVVYGLRHSFASRLNESDFNAFQIKDLLGHSDIKTTLNYVTINQASISKKINKVKF